MKRWILTMFWVGLYVAPALCACAKATPSPTPRPRPTARIAYPTPASPSADSNKEILAGMPIQHEPPTQTASPRPSDTPGLTLEPTAQDADQTSQSGAPAPATLEPTAGPQLGEASRPTGEIAAAELPTATADPDKEGLLGAPVFMRPTPSDTPIPGSEPAATPMDEDEDKEFLFEAPVPLTPNVLPGLESGNAPELSQFERGLVMGTRVPAPPPATPTSRDAVRRLLADRENLWGVPVLLRPRARLLPALCGLSDDEPRPAIGLRITGEKAMVCLAGFPSDQPLHLSLFAPSGQLVGERAGRVAAGEPIAVVEIELDLPTDDRTGAWRVVIQLREEAIEREISVQG